MGITIDCARYKIDHRVLPKIVIDYYHVNLEYYFKDGSKDTILVDVYENPNGIQLTNGDLHYSKITGATGGAVAGETTIASYVRSFKILTCEKRQIVEK